MERRDQPREPRRIRVTDRRRVPGARGAPEEAASSGSERAPGDEFVAEAVGAVGDAEQGRTEAEKDSAPEAPAADPEIERLTTENERLLRHVAELDNKLKRMVRDHTESIERANRSLIGKLLSVLDNFDRAIEHADDETGLDIVHKELLRVLADEGLEEIQAQGGSFDYHVHEAIASHEDPEVDHEIVSEVYQKGYRLKGRVIRPAKVVVARPAEAGSSESAQEG